MKHRDFIKTTAIMATVASLFPVLKSNGLEIIRTKAAKGNPIFKYPSQ